MSYRIGGWDGNRVGAGVRIDIGLGEPWRSEGGTGERGLLAVGKNREVVCLEIVIPHWIGFLRLEA